MWRVRIGRAAVGERDDPAFVPAPKGHGVEVVEAVSSASPDDDQLGVDENAEVLHDREAAQFGGCVGQLAGRPATPACAQLTAE